MPCVISDRYHRSDKTLISLPAQKAPATLASVRKTVLRRNCQSGKPHEADRAVAGEAKRRDRKAESRKPNGMGAADERLQGAGRSYREV